MRDRRQSASAPYVQAESGAAGGLSGGTWETDLEASVSFQYTNWPLKGLVYRCTCKLKGIFWAGRRGGGEAVYPIRPGTGCVVCGFRASLAVL